MITSSRATDYTCIYDKVVQLQYTQTEQQVVLDKLSWYCTYYEHIDKVDNRIYGYVFFTTEHMSCIKWVLHVHVNWSQSSLTICFLCTSSLSVYFKKKKLKRKLPSLGLYQVKVLIARVECKMGTFNNLLWEIVAV